MPTAKQDLGALGERVVISKCACPRCKRLRTLRRLPTNFRCADVICDFCGYLAQVKTTNVVRVDRCPPRLAGAAWGPQLARMQAGIYFPLFIVLVGKEGSLAIYYLSADLQTSKMFLVRKPLSAQAKRAGWRGFMIDLSGVAARGLVCVHRLQAPKGRRAVATGGATRL